ncbi:MAG: hypothetical protein IJ157_04400 [Clostridia bacterium]|nr:hypothetical protein [Clostridia bacterium]
MYQPGDYVVYGDNGLCLVERVGVPDFNADQKTEYYFLRTSDDGSRIYVPVDTRMPLRAPMSAQEARDFLEQLPGLPISLPERRDRKSVLSHYQEMLRPHTAKSLAQVIKSIRWHHRATPGRMSGAEEMLLKRAKQQLCGELAGALSITGDEAQELLEKAVSVKPEN